MLHPEHGKEEVRERVTIREYLDNSQSSLVELSTDRKSGGLYTDTNWPIWLRWAYAPRSSPLGANRLKLFLIVILACYVVGFAGGILYVCYRKFYELQGFFSYVLFNGNEFAKYSICSGLLSLILLYWFERSKVPVRPGAKVMAAFGISPIILSLS